MKGLSIALSVLVLSSAPAPAPAAALNGPTIKTRAVAYWYLPTVEEDTYRRFKVDAVIHESVVTGTELTTRVTRDICTQSPGTSGQVLSCPLGDRATWTTNSGQMEVAPDLSTARLIFRLNGARHHVQWSSPTQFGAWDTRSTCSSGVAAAGGLFRNMGEFEGKILGRTLIGPIESDDHAWIERGPALSTC